MNSIISIRELAPKIFEAIIDAPQLARKARAGQFVVVMTEEKGERIPLTFADWDSGTGTITIVFMVVGASSYRLSQFKVGDSLYALAGPFGQPSEIENFGTVVMVAGGVGTAPVYPIARALKKEGNSVVMIQGARSKELLFWVDHLKSVSDEHLITTDDGTFGRKGLVTEPLKESLEKDKSIKRVYAIGPAIMMKFCAKTTQPFGVKTIVSLNSIMIDATGMCGGCRVSVKGNTRFTCVDGPEFDGHEVDWDILLNRQKIYLTEEKHSFEMCLGRINK
jgi:ferredoxin--NADP+ reductase